MVLLVGCSRRTDARPMPSGLQGSPSSAVATYRVGAPAVEPAADAAFDATAWVLADSARRAFVLYVPTPHEVVDKMLEVARIRRDDVLYDLGCGDGRIPVEAALEYGIKATCIDIDPQRVAEARASVESAGVSSLVTVRQANAFDVDLSPATVVALYMSSRILAKLVPQLCGLSPGARIVTHDYDIPGLEADGYWSVTSAFFGRHNELFEAGIPEDDPRYPRTLHHVFLWTTPLRGCPSRRLDRDSGP
jgi:SAM-dependent methyltransferase